MKSHKKSTLGPLQYLLIIFLRFIFFDWWLNRLSDVKYYIQTSSWWPTIRSWHVTQTLNRLWTMPKRMLFDNKSDDLMESRSRHLQQSPAHKQANGVHPAITVNGRLNGGMNGVGNGHSNRRCKHTKLIEQTQEDSISRSRRSVTVATGYS